MADPTTWGGIKVQGLTLEKLARLTGTRHNVKAYGALGDGTTDDTAAIQAAIDAARDAGGGIVDFPRGRYQVTSALSLTTNHVGIVFCGVGWSAGSTPASNKGSWLEYTESTGTLLEVGTGVGFVRDIVLSDIGIQATHASYSGELVDLRGVSFFTAGRCGFYGRQDQTPAANHVLVSGNAWVDLAFARCVFHSSGYGIRQVSIDGVGDYANVIRVGDSEFNRLTVAMDVQRSAQDVWIDGGVFEPAAGSAESPVRIFANPVGVQHSWFGDGDGTANWLEIKGTPIRVIGNYIAGAAIGLRVVDGSRAGIVASNSIAGCATGIKHEASSAPAAVVEDNFIFELPTSGIGIDVAACADGVLRHNTVDKASGASSTTGYKLAVGTSGSLIDNQAGSADTHITDNSSGGWTKVVNYQTEYAYSIGGYSPSRLYRVQGITNLSSPVGNGLCDFTYLTARAGLRVGYSASGTTPGNVTKKLEIFDAAGTSLGFIAVYDAIT